MEYEFSLFHLSLDSTLQLGVAGLVQHDAREQVIDQR